MLKIYHKTRKPVNEVRIMKFPQSAMFFNSVCGKEKQKATNTL
jgi:hypothetical protein